jgi:orotidine-5'-phosphate decarboxylase
VTAFGLRLAARIARFGPLCIGIDPSAKLLASAGLPDSAEGAYAFGARVLEAARFELAMIKPQSAYFERYGSAGIAALERLLELARRHEVLTLLDVKRGDIDSTAEAYAQAYFAPHSTLRVDAITWHPYLGFGGLAQGLDYAGRHGGGGFVVVRSSNSEGVSLQNAREADGRRVAEALADAIEAHNATRAERPGALGAVIGATCEDADAIAARMPSGFVLAPGVGAQGASFADIARRMPAARGRVLPNVSRAVLAQGGGRESIAAAIGALKKACSEALG